MRKAVLILLALGMTLFISCGEKSEEQAQTGIKEQSMEIIEKGILSRSERARIPLWTSTGPD